MYLKSLFAVPEEEMYIKNQGVSIGSAVAPVLRILYLAKLDRDIQERMTVLAIFRYVDDYLAFHRMNHNEGKARIAEEMISLAKELAGD